VQAGKATREKIGAAVFDSVGGVGRDTQQSNSGPAHLTLAGEGKLKRRQRCKERMNQSEKSNERICGKFARL
jgi:hypothetical protein